MRSAAVECSIVGGIERRIAAQPLDQVRVGQSPTPHRRHVRQSSRNIRPDCLKRPVYTVNQQRVLPARPDVAQKFVVAVVGEMQIDEDKLCKFGGEIEVKAGVEA
jgi:hypothetical protein